ncbi:MAG: hypothetical protein ACR2FY_26205 [Pirellulaceae bacterium]
MKPRREVFLLCLLFAALYFVQGFAEPTEGLIAQPVRAQLRHLKMPTGEIAFYAMLIGLPWSFKLLFGLASDFVPLFGSRRKSYLLLSTLTAAVSLLVLAAIPLELQRLTSIFGLIFAASLGIAFTDVVVDALAVTAGQKHGLTGRFQAIQWGAIYTATIMTGSIGGWLSQHRLPWLGFLICGCLAAVSLLMTLLIVKEPVDERVGDFSALRSLWSTLQSPLVWTVGGFLFLWNFNPFSSVVQEAYMKGQLQLDEQFIGNARSISAVGSILACAAYAILGPRIPVRWLTHGSITAGVLSSLVYLVMWNGASALGVSLLSGLFYMSGTLVQLDLAARACKAESAGTTFAALMALSNTGMSLGIWLGGSCYDWLGVQLSNVPAAFALLVVLGSLSTAACWLLVPLLRVERLE